MINDLDIAAIVSRCAVLVREKYLFADVGERLGELLVQRLADGAYDRAGEAEQLAVLVTADLQSVNGDKHLNLKHHIDPLPDLTDRAAERAAYAEEARDAMNAVRQVARLDGNVGLLCFAPVLYPAVLVGGAIAAAMALIADASALIVDARELYGGDPATVALVCSYLVDDHALLHSMVPRDAGKAVQSWTMPWVPGPRFGGRKPVWVLTSSATFSGGEALAYDLQQLGRVTVVGERTGGGAHVREGFDVHPHLELTVPVVAARNAVSGTNWEGTGVSPDVPVAAADALTTAHGLALDALVKDGSISARLRREIAASASQK